MGRTPTHGTLGSHRKAENMKHPYRTPATTLQTKNHIGLRLLRSPVTSVVLTLGVPLVTLLILYGVGTVTRETEVAGESYLGYGATFGITLQRGFVYTVGGIGPLLLLVFLVAGIVHIFLVIQKLTIEASLARMTQDEVNDLPPREIARLQKVTSNRKLTEAQHIRKGV